MSDKGDLWVEGLRLAVEVLRATNNGTGYRSSDDEPIPTARTLTNEEAESLRVSLRREMWDEQKHKLLKVSLTNTKLTCEQARCIIKTFTFEKGKAGAWLVKNGKISDMHNVHEMTRDLMMWDKDEVLGALD